MHLSILFVQASGRRLTGSLPIAGASLLCALAGYPVGGWAHPLPELTPSLNQSLFPASEVPLGHPLQVAQVTENAAGAETIVELPQLQPRVGATVQSGSGVGYERSFGGGYGFLPFQQTPGISTFYTEGRINTFLGDEGEDTFSGNIRLGYRTLLPNRNWVLGSYMGWDSRRQEDATFHQIGLGAEVLADRWGLRLNGYLPVSKTEREATSLRTGFFQDNRPMIVRTLDEALAGLDIEGSYRVLDWENGSLYAAVNPYYLTAESTDSFLGIRGRLSAEWNQFNTGIALSSDSNFGTNVTFQMGVTFGGHTRRQRQPDGIASVIARLGQPVQRQEIIALDRRVTDPTMARNPDTGQAYRFFHVTDGIAGGSGTTEDPFGEVTDAVALAQTTGNDVVYVDAGDRSGMNGFISPAAVQVLVNRRSTGSRFIRWRKHTAARFRYWDTTADQRHTRHCRRVNWNGAVGHKFNPVGI